MKQSERTGRICAHCRRAFALDPKTDGRGMHDTRIRRIALRATGGGRLTITLTQLWYLSRTHNAVWSPTPARGVRPGIRWLVAVPVAAALIGAAVFTGGWLATVFGTGAAAVLVTASRMEYRPAAAGGSWISPSGPTFRRLMTDRWRAAYGGLPDGVLDDAAPAGAAAPAGRAEAGPLGGGAAPAARATGGTASVIVCTDHAVAVFLTANGLPARLRSRLVEVPEDSGAKAALDALEGIPARLPVVVLHDASAQGVLLAPLIRAVHPDRVVVDGGLHPRHVRDRKGTVRLYSRVPRDGLGAEELRTVARLREADAEWLAKGFRSPLAAVPPALLLSAAEAAVRRATRSAASSRSPAASRATDRASDRAKASARAAAPVPAQAQGFLTWPDPAPGTARASAHPASGTSGARGKKGTRP
ncbi:hypothetical protein [Streptomyces antimicrobicus]|uniref:Uncharacterized protein n=1 Tax=Streptomyces antimicrobicus TaxID=2883108 RepID=A0ABS8BAN7_9ACTN|nr:hypothetical protein [Streptomyces antimicrobicus]MCB5181664.1 hypothetical protein [Streptomyces antimicrobicus]